MAQGHQAAPSSLHGRRRLSAPGFLDGSSTRSGDSARAQNWRPTRLKTSPNPARCQPNRRTRRSSETMNGYSSSTDTRSHASRRPTRPTYARTGPLPPARMAGGRATLSKHHRLAQKQWRSARVVEAVPRRAKPQDWARFGVAEAGENQHPFQPIFGGKGNGKLGGDGFRQAGFCRCGQARRKTINAWVLGGCSKRQWIGRRDSTTLVNA